MRRLLGKTVALAVVLALVGCSKAPDVAVVPPADLPDLAGRPMSTVTELDPAQALGLASKAMAEVSDATYAGTADIWLGRAEHRFSTEWVLARGGCQVTNTSRAWGEITTRQLKGSSFDRYDRRAVVHLLGLPGYYAQDLARKWLRSDRALLGSDACSATELVPAPRWRSTFRAGAVVRVDGHAARRFDGRNAYGPVSVWVATTSDPVVLRWRGRAAGESRDLWLRSLDKGKKLTRPSAQQTADLP